MKTTHAIRMTAAVALAAVTLTACAANEQDVPDTGTALRGELAGSGASSQGSAQEAWQASFQKAHSAVTVNYDGGGSGAGREAFTAGAVQFAGSDRAFKVDEIAAGGFGACAEGSNLVELPLYISPIAVAFNLDGISELNLDAVTIARIFRGEITRWNDPAIAGLNAGVTLPDLAITPVIRSDKSGTTGNFTDYLGAVAPEAWDAGSVEEWPYPTTTHEAVSGTSGVADALRTVGTIGYIDASRAPGSVAAIKVGDTFVRYTPEAAAAVVDASPIEEGRSTGDIAIRLDRTTTAPGTYPIVLISYLIGCEQYRDPAQGALVQAYFSHIASEAGQQEAAAKAGSAPISAELRTRVQSAIDRIQ